MYVYNVFCTFCFADYHSINIVQIQDNALRLGSLLVNSSKSLSTPPTTDSALVKRKCPWIITFFLFLMRIDIVLEDILLQLKNHLDKENINVIILYEVMVALPLKGSPPRFNKLFNGFVWYSSASAANCQILMGSSTQLKRKKSVWQLFLSNNKQFSALCLKEIKRVHNHQTQQSSTQTQTQKSTQT